jgi:hypothetical protein
VSKDVICPSCGLNTGSGRWSKGAMATHIKFKHKGGKWKRDKEFVSKEDHEKGRKRKTPGKTYKKKVI